MSIRKHIAFALVLLTLLVPCCIANTPDLKLHQKCLYPTVMIALEGYGSGGTGVIIRSTKVGNEYHNVFISAGHVANHPGAFNIHVYEYKDHSTIKGHTVLPCSFYAINTEEDIAIGVFISAKEMPTAQISFDQKIFIGNDVFRIGCGLGDEPRLDVGKVSSVRTKMGRHNELIRTTVHTLPGDSGSALFSDYNVVGIMIMIRAREGPGGIRQIIPNMSYAVPVQKFQSWNTANKNALSFAWNAKEAIPVLPLLEIKFMRDTEIIDDD